MNKMFNLGQGIVKWFACLFIGLLALTGLVLFVQDTSWFEYFQIQVNPLYTLGSLIVFVLLFVGIIKLIEAKPNLKWKKIGFFVCFVFCTITLLKRIVPNWDQLWIQAAIEKVRGNYELYNTTLNTFIEDKFNLEDYFAACPNLIRNILYQSLFPNYLVFYTYNIILYLITYDLGLKITEDKGKYFGTLYCMCLPISMYTSFFYGEITAIFGIAASIYLVKEILNHNDIKKNLIILFIINFIMVWEKENTAIFVIAEVLTLILFMFKNEKISKLLCVIVIVISALLVSPSAKLVAHLNGAYEIGYSDSWSFIAMGLHDHTDEYNPEGSLETGIEGGYDGTNHKLAENNYENYLKATREAKEDIKVSIQNFKENPKYAVKFFFNKIVKQWNSNDFNTNHFIRLLSMEKLEIISELQGEDEEGQYIFEYAPYQNTIDKIEDFFSNGERMFIYLVTFVSCVYIIKKKKELSYIEIVCLVTFIGNFLFSIIWEAKPRYCIYGYFALLIFASLQIGKTRLNKDEMKLAEISNKKI